MHIYIYIRIYRSILELESQLVPFFGISAVGSDPCTLQVSFAAVVVSFASYVGLFGPLGSVPCTLPLTPHSLRSVPLYQGHRTMSSRKHVSSSSYDMHVSSSSYDACILLLI